MYAPETLEQEKKVPVVIWIHGLVPSSSFFFTGGYYTCLTIASIPVEGRIFWAVLRGFSDPSTTEMTSFASLEKVSSSSSSNIGLAFSGSCQGRK